MLYSTMTASLEWTSGMSPEFQDKWLTEGGGDIDTSKLRECCNGRLNDFELLYIKAAHREVSVYRFLTGESLAQPFSVEHSPKALLDNIFAQHWYIGHQAYRSSTNDETEYNECLCHPMRDMITRQFRFWSEDSHRIIQGFIDAKWFETDEIARHQTERDILPIVMSQQERLGDQSRLRLLHSELLLMIKKELFLKRSVVHKLNVDEQEYLQSIT